MNVLSIVWLNSAYMQVVALARQTLRDIPTPKPLLYIEWIIIVCSAVVYGFFSGSILKLVSPGWGPFPFLLIFFLLSFIFPGDRPRWQKYIYIAIEIALITIAMALRLGIELFAYLFIAKACFLFNRKDITVIVILTAVAYHIPLLWTVPENLEYQRLHPQEVFNSSRWTTMAWVESVFTYITATTFVLLFSFSVLAEQRAQQHAKKLVQEVQTLSIMLERERIARDIHDALGHTLTALNIQLEVAQQIGASDVPQMLRRLEITKHLADQCLQDVRQVVQTMRASDFDLTQALMTLITQMQQTQTLRSRPIWPHVQLNLPSLPLQTSYQLYCIVKEGLINIQKHADATHVQLNGWKAIDRLIIELADNGKGFDLTQLSQGFGLKGIQERTQLLGGVFQIQTAPGQGTKLIVQIPLPASGILIMPKLEAPQ
jgi:signal transduction histidine kinase